jgi:hypothetical protein
MITRRHHITGLDLFQGAGLVILIAFIYLHFGPGVHSRASWSVIAVLAIGIIMLLWPTALKARH